MSAYRAIFLVTNGVKNKRVANLGRFQEIISLQRRVRLVGLAEFLKSQHYCDFP
jgi:hypothetical protein